MSGDTPVHPYMRSWREQGQLYLFSDCRLVKDTVSWSRGFPQYVLPVLSRGKVGSRISRAALFVEQAVIRFI